MVVVAFFIVDGPAVVVGTGVVGVKFDCLAVVGDGAVIVTFSGIG